MNFYLKKTRRWSIGCLLVLAISCGESKIAPLIITQQDSIAQTQLVARAFKTIDDVSKIIKTGDLIVRTGNDFTSESLRNLNQRDQTYSHCGIASIENDSVFVYHALGGEFNPDQKIKREPLNGFSEPYSNRGIGIYRFNIATTELNNCVQTAKKLYKMGVMFDMEFDLQSNDRMYCAEFAYKTYNWGSKGRLKFNISQIKNFHFIGVDDLFLHPQCTLQKKIFYK
jgi:hypothetical protein